MLLTAKIQTRIEMTQTYETAAWYETAVLNHGNYELKGTEVKPNYYNGGASMIFSATIPATIESDNFQSLFCGNAVGKHYDQNQNKGKSTTRTLSADPIAALFNPMFSVPEEFYDKVLELAKAQIQDRLKIASSCLSDTVKDALENKFISGAGHASQVLDLLQKYSAIDGVQGRRAYNLKNNGQGWSEKETHLEKTAAA